MSRKSRPLKKFAQVKRIISPADPRLKSNQVKAEKERHEAEREKVKEAPQVATSLFFRHNTALSPPYQVLVDTNFIHQSIRHKLDLKTAMMDCLYADAVPCITDCVMAELEKMGAPFRLALKIARDARWERLPCMHRGTYADDCLVQRVTAHRCYIVATCDRGLKQRLRKIPGVPIMYIAGHKYNVEQLPEAYGVMF
jgi:U3 small nucleolar RNA-associated protein 24